MKHFLCLHNCQLLWRWEGITAHTRSERNPNTCLWSELMGGNDLQKSIEVVWFYLAWSSCKLINTDFQSASGLSLFHIITENPIIPSKSTKPHPDFDIMWMVHWHRHQNYQYVPLHNANMPSNDGKLIIWHSRYFCNDKFTLRFL